MTKSAHIAAGRLLLGLISACAGLALGSAAAGADVDLSGKRIQLIVPVAPGASADLSARFVAPLLAERLPGKPTIIIRNVAGAGSIAGSNEFQNRARPDGTDLILQTPSAMLNYVFHDPRVHYKLNEWIPIAGMSQGMVVYSNASLGIKDGAGLAGLGDKQVVMAANSATGIDLGVLLPLDLLGVAVKPVFGMNRGEVYPGFQRGEFNISFDAYAAYKSEILPLVEGGTAVPLFSLGYTDASGAVGRDPTVPDLPHFLELYEKVKGQPLAGPERQAWDAVYNLNVMSTRAILLPAGTPQDVVDTYTKAVAQLVADIAKDPGLREQAANFIGPQPMTTGEAAQRNMKSAVDFSPEGYAWLKDWLKQRYDVTVQ
jgi:tripartite-type tricarboxylate transporter receptor subunit TctC